LIPPARAGHRGPFPETDEMEAVEIETKTTTGIAIVTETEPGNTVAMITNADAVTKTETKRAVVETATARRTKETIGSDEGRGRKM